MKIIKPSVEFYGAVPTDYEGALKFIEIAGRTCYKSEDRITDTSAEGFVKKLIKAGHLAMVEHSNFVVRIQKMDNFSELLQGIVGKYLTVVNGREYTYVGGNLTAWIQAHDLNSSLKAGVFVPFAYGYGELFDRSKRCAGSKLWQVCPHDEIPKELHRYSAKFICDRGVTHELVRHRPCSFAQESTRYVNYGGKDMEFIEPAGYDEWRGTAQFQFRRICEHAEEAYNELLHIDLKPQQARAVLPNALKTEIVVTADVAEWAHIRKLRTHPSAHPDMVRVMNMMPWDFLESM